MLTIAGQSVGPCRTGHRRYVLLLSSDFGTRRLWTTFTGSKGLDERSGIVERHERLRRRRTCWRQAGTARMQPEPLGSAEAFVASWKTR